MQAGMTAAGEERLVDDGDEIVLAEAGPDALLQQLAGAVGQLGAAPQPVELLGAAEPADVVVGAGEVGEGDLGQEPAQLVELLVWDGARQADHADGRPLQASPAELAGDRARRRRPEAAHVLDDAGGAGVWGVVVEEK